MLAFHAALFAGAFVAIWWRAFRWFAADGRPGVTRRTATLAIVSTACVAAAIGAIWSVRGEHPKDRAVGEHLASNQRAVREISEGRRR